MGKQWIITVETVHNWRNRKAEWAGYYSDMPATAYKAITMAHDEHHNKGRNARECVEELVGRFECLIT